MTKFLLTLQTPQFSTRCLLHPGLTLSLPLTCPGLSNPALYFPLCFCSPWLGNQGLLRALGMGFAGSDAREVFKHLQASCQIMLTIGLQSLLLAGMRLGKCIPQVGTLLVMNPLLMWSEDMANT